MMIILVVLDDRKKNKKLWATRTSINIECGVYESELEEGIWFKLNHCRSKS
jgi:hypothetical protein